ncbi:hypothetical protein ACQY1Q_01995 [Tenacibaculum sp. TC6]|uniref:hypothetical protein n=1 Tax=Tenacibaculum sp. TC6 TaxID=3423223 RepID=UPI003D361A93
MKKLFSLLFFYSIIAYSQQYNYNVKITNYNYQMYAKSGLCGDAKHVRLSVTDVNNYTYDLFFTGNPYDLVKSQLVDRYFVNEIKSIKFSSYIHEQDAVGLCNGYTASVSETRNVVYDSNNFSSGTITGTDNGGGQAIINFSFDYEITKVKKNYSYKLEYDIDLSNKSNIEYIPFDNYSGNYKVTLDANLEKKIVYNESVITSYNSDLIQIRNIKYDSIVRFINPIDLVVARTNISFRTSSMLACVDSNVDSNGITTLDSTENTNVDNEKGCLAYNYIFPPCGSITVNHFNLYRIYEDPKLISGNVNEGFSNLELKNCEPLKFYVNDCNQTSSYAVEYSVGTGNFKPYLAYGRRGSFFELDAKNIEGAGIGSNVNIRVKYYDKDCEQYAYLCSKILTFKVVPCSPQIVMHPSNGKTSCSYKKDGNFSFTVNRKLEENEKLIVTLYYEFSPGNFNAYKQQVTDVLEEVTDNGVTTYKFTWDNNLDSLDEGKYYVKFQTIKGAGTINQNDPSWASVEETNTFQIEIVSNVSFAAKLKNNESCFLSGDGKIEIYDVSGEQGRTFEYIIYELQGGTTMVVKDWTSFSNSSVIVDNLKKATYRIKVKDSKGCLAK